MREVILSYFYLETVTGQSERHEAVQESAKETAKKLIKKGKMSLDEIADCIPALSLDELRELEAEVMQLT